MNGIYIKSKQILALAIAACLACGNCMAQKNKTARKPKTEKKHQTAAKDDIEKDYASLNPSDFLSAIAKITVIDSIVADKEDFYKKIPLTPDCGKIGEASEITGATRQQPVHYAYTNGYGDTRYYSAQSEDGTSKLYKQEKIGRKWTNAKAVEELNEKVSDIDFPYLMSDGVTLYFSGISKDNSFGKRDIFMARLNTYSMSFYKPENIGLPFNSKADDYMCVIDDMNNLGWLVTDRRQHQGKVCIYTFIPSDERWDATEIGNAKKLSALAEIQCIKDTQKNADLINQAKLRLKTLTEKAAVSKQNTGFPFIVNDNRIYQRIEDFRSETGKGLFVKLVQMINELRNDKEKLAMMRSSYSEAGRNNKELAKKITEMEASAGKKAQDIKNMEKKIRNAENLL